MTPEVEAVLKTLPRRIKVGAYDWRIKLIAGESETCGLTVFERAEIHIWPDEHATPERIVGTVLHELLHTIYDDSTDEEDIVSLFETGLIALYRDNPKLLNWIKRGLKTNAEANQ